MIDLALILAMITHGSLFLVALLSSASNPAVDRASFPVGAWGLCMFIIDVLATLGVGASGAGLVAL